jgi:hypothetical protein
VGGTDVPLNAILQFSYSLATDDASFQKPPRAANSWWLHFSKEQKFARKLSRILYGVNFLFLPCSYF